MEDVMSSLPSLQEAFFCFGLSRGLDTEVVKMMEQKTED
jgi:hypothetical protein